MSVITTFPFENEINYSLVNTEITIGGTGQLALVDKPSQNFSEDFASSAGLTFDAQKTEFVGGVMRQIDQRPANATFHANYNTNENGNWGDGVLAGTLVGGAVVSGGKLDLTGNTGAKYCNYDGVDNGGASQIGCVRMKFTPKSTAPSGIWAFFTESQAFESDNNELFLFQDSGGSISFRMKDSTGTQIFNQPLSTFVWTIDQEYELELNWDLNTGASRFFIDGIQHGVTVTTTGTRTNVDVFRVGNFTSSPSVGNDFLIDDFVYFDAVQHTTNYTPGAAIPQTIYATDTILIPDFIYSGLEFIQSLELLTTTEVNSPHFTIEGKYWDGANWVASDGSFTQSNDKSTINANIAALVLSSQTEISVQVVWSDSNNQMSVDNLDIEYTGQEFAAEGTILTNNAFIAQEILSFDAVEINPPDPQVSAIRYIINANGVDRWHDGINWVNSNGTSAESNTLAEVQANILVVISGNVTLKIKVVLTSDGTKTHEIDSLTVTYNFGALEPVAPQQSQVFGFLKDAENNPIENASIVIKPARQDIQYKEAADRIIAGEIKLITNDEGFFSANLIVSSEFEPLQFQYIITITLEGATDPIFLNGEFEILFTVPDQPTTNLTDVITAV